MKKHLLSLTIAVVCTLSVTHAQIKKGATFLGGSISGTTTKTERSDTLFSKEKGLIISPAFGKAIKENLVLGVDLSIRVFNNDFRGNSLEQRNHSYGGGVFLRKYKQLGSSGFSVFGQGRLGVTFDKYKNNSTSMTYSEITKGFGVLLSFYPGLSYSVSKRLQLETGFYDLLSINYSRSKRTVINPTLNEYKTTDFGVSSSLSNASPLYLGFRLLLN
ncbi:MAG TPA: hypothetical protein VHN59_20090 [Chitinophagaceae bacterium]|nr:hypothetical protein [Chitinophagaceae bacterium]